MTEQEIINLIGFGICVAWFCKIAFHFVYLKAVDKNIKELNFISFYLNFNNFFTSIMIIAPFFVSRDRNDGHEIQEMRTRAKLSSWTLWAVFVLMRFYIYNHPPKTEPARIEYVSRMTK
jgi:hypothetical protein